MENRGTAGGGGYTICIRVRHHEVDLLGHVNNAVYLNYAEEAAIAHGEHAGYGIAQMREKAGGIFVVRRHEITYHHPAVAGEELAVTTRVTAMGGVRATRCTTIVSTSGGRLIAEAKTEWVWVGNEGRPRRIPEGVLAAFPLE
jgi:acyl-CoA thioester hydrolase